MTPDLSIVIPTFGRAGSLATVLEALEAQQPNTATFEVILAVDAIGTREQPEDLAAADRSFPITVTVAEKPGASAARNTGWRLAAAPLVLFLDDDVVPCRELVAQHLSWHLRHPGPEVGVIGVVRWSPRVRVTPFMRWLEMGNLFDYGTIRSTELEWQRLYSCNVSLKRTILERTGGFDEDRFPFRYEDLELARRMHHEHGFRLLYNPAAVGDHLKTETLESWRAKLPQVAAAERAFTELYPDEPAFFHDRFQAAAQARRARGRSARLAQLVGPKTPWLGRFVWQSFDLVCTQRLAPTFLEAWEAAGRDTTAHATRVPTKP